MSRGPSGAAPPKGDRPTDSAVSLPPDIAEALRAHGVVLVDKRDSPLMRALSVVLWPLLGPSFLRDFWTTLRFPLCAARIYCPTAGPRAEAHRHSRVMRHELVHVRQLAPWYGPPWLALLYLLVPMPVLLSGRWLVERPAYLGDIRALVAEGRPADAAIDWAVGTLWRAYGWPWPRSWMRRWFAAQL